MRLVLKSPCKVNLLLNILGKRPDGFHELETVMHPVPHYDRLSFEPASAGVLLTCSDPALPVDDSNLVCRAVRAFLGAAGLAAGIRIHLEKNIPLSAGLGGGSGNAATTLLGLNQSFGLPLSQGRLMELAAALGSDVPFFLQDSPALATGRGEKVQSLAGFPALNGIWVLLAHPGFGIPTFWAYQGLARFPEALNGRPGRAASLIKSLERGDLAAAAPEFYNSLEAPVLDKYPLLALYQEFLRAQGAWVARMSGSGSATYALLPDRAEAGRLRERFLARFGASVWTALVQLGPGSAGAGSSAAEDAGN
jgi:4-diphosphocytidyl-2-C-methyl-D-erythritol kinase